MSDNNQALKDAGLKVTLPRLKILEVLQQPDCQHISAEDLYKKLNVTLTNHSLYLYGKCSDGGCKDNPDAHKPKK
ncbi:transcriptional repressor [Vibrio alginolyticus]